MIKFFKKYPEIIAGMSEKKDGSMRLFQDGILKKDYINNRRKYFQKIGINYENVISAQLVNGIEVAVIKKNKKKIIPQADALIAREKEIYLSITVADCLPIFFYDFQAKIIGLAHAGWRGIAGGIIQKTIKKMVSLGGNPQNMVVAVGPGINRCHFEIKKDVLKKFKQYNKFVEKRNNKYWLDLRGIVQKQLRANGIREKNIENKNECTFCQKEKYFSYRRDGSQNISLLTSVIGQK
jgi:YfiH family protein